MAPARLPFTCVFVALALATPACGDDGDGVATTDTTSGEVIADAVGDAGCDPFANTGCRAGEACTYTPAAGDTPVCAAAGIGTAGDACSVDAPCASGICLSLNETPFSCFAFCDDADPCPADAPCLELASVSYRVCELADLYETCDVLTQPCGDHKGCYTVAGQADPICLPAGALQVGGDCTGDAAACSPGMACVSREDLSHSTCFSYCDHDANETGCNPGTCLQLGELDVGYCDPDV